MEAPHNGKGDRAVIGVIVVSYVMIQLVSNYLLGEKGDESVTAVDSTLWLWPVVEVLLLAGVLGVVFIGAIQQQWKLREWGLVDNRATYGLSGVIGAILLYLLFTALAPDAADSIRWHLLAGLVPLILGNELVLRAGLMHRIRQSATADRGALVVGALVSGLLYSVCFPLADRDFIQLIGSMAVLSGLYLLLPSILIFGFFSVTMALSAKESFWAGLLMLVIYWMITLVGQRLGRGREKD